MNMVLFDNLWTLKNKEETVSKTSKYLETFCFICLLLSKTPNCTKITKNTPYLIN